MGWKFNAPDRENQEALEYRPGQRVELKQRPGVVDTILEYDSMMVPPIMLANDPKPRYPEELRLLPNRTAATPGLRPLSRPNSRVLAPSCALVR